MADEHIFPLLRIVRDTESELLPLKTLVEKGKMKDEMKELNIQKF